MASRTKKAKRVKRAVTLTGAHRALGQSVKFWWRHFKTVGAVAAIALGVNWLLGLASGTGSGGYRSIWFVMATGAFIWTIRHIGGKATVKWRQAFWSGTAPVLKLVLVILLLALCSLPFSIGTYLFGAIRALAGSSWWLVALSGGVWLALGIVSLLLLARLLPSLVIATLPDVGPGQAIGTSWRISQGVASRIVIRLTTVLVYLLMLVVLITVGLARVHASVTIIQLVLQVLSFMWLMPISYIWLFRLYKELV